MPEIIAKIKLNGKKYRSWTYGNFSLIDEISDALGVSDADIEIVRRTKET